MEETRSHSFTSLPSPLCAMGQFQLSVIRLCLLLKFAVIDCYHLLLIMDRAWYRLLGSVVGSHACYSLQGCKFNTALKQRRLGFTTVEIVKASNLFSLFHFFVSLFFILFYSAAITSKQTHTFYHIEYEAFLMIVNHFSGNNPNFCYVTVGSQKCQNLGQFSRYQCRTGSVPAAS